MKTVEELAEEYVAGLESEQPGTYNQCYYSGALEDAFRYGYEAANRWISIEEELPTYDQRTWLFCIFDYPKLENKARLACWNPKRKKFECAYMSEVIEDYVTHWMPLPAGIQKQMSKTNENNEKETKLLQKMPQPILLEIRTYGFYTTLRKIVHKTSK